MSLLNCRPVGGRSQTFDVVIQVLSDDGTRVIGEIQDSTFIQSSWHSVIDLCHKHNAIGLDKVAFLRYILPSATFIVIPDEDTGREYTATVEDFRQFAIEDDQGCGTQLFLPLLYWSVIEPDGTKSTQLRLFYELVNL